jgi:predicted ATPase/DNA-binding CsgD family transcriptional regulator
MNTGDGRSAQPTVESLTRREREVLALLVQGYSGAEIAGKLTLALSSVRWHLQQMYAKLGVNNKRHAVARAHALGLLPVAAGAAPHAAAAIPPSSPNHNLPLQVTHFFGREDEIAQVEARLAEQRLVTLVGPGGVGKTRLSLRVAEAQLRGHAHGVWLVELAPLVDAERVALQVAFILGVREEPERAIRQTLIAYLRGRQLLLVLDNCEHLLDACAQLTDGLLRACPALKILATSREPLGPAGEAVFPVSPLPVPDPQLAASVEGIGSIASVSLFADRAGLVWPDFKVTEHNVATLARICRRIDGLPLAIEMAAARVNLLTVEQIASRLDDVFQLLTGGSRTALPRQQTLRATIDWSYNLLSEAERLLLQRLSVFAGGCGLEAAEAVCTGEGLAADAVLDLLASLVAKSLVGVTRRNSGVARYSLLEMVRQYGREKLEQAGDTARRFGRQRDYFLTLAEAANSSANYRAWSDAAALLMSELDNLRAALEWSFGDDTHPEAAPRLVLGATDFWQSHFEASAWHKRAVAWCERHPEVPPRLFAKLLTISGPVAQDEPRLRLAWLQKAVAIGRGLGPEDEKTYFQSLFGLAEIFFRDLNDLEQALAILAEVEAIVARSPINPADWFGGRLGRMAWVNHAKAQIAIKQGHYDVAKQYEAECMPFARAADGPDVMRSVLIIRAIAEQNLGEYDEARADLLQALDLLDSEYGYVRRYFESYLAHLLGEVEYKQGNLDPATAYLHSSLNLGAAQYDNILIANNLGLAAGLAARHGKRVRAATLSAAAQTVITRQGRKLWSDYTLDTLLPGWRDGLERSAIEQAYAAGQAMTSDEAVAYALADDVS